MDIQPTSTQPISDDQELAKVLAGVSNTADDSEDKKDEDAQTPVSQVVPPVAAGEPPKADDLTADDATLPAPQAPPVPAQELASPDMPVMPELPELPAIDTTGASSPLPAPQAAGELDDVKKDAINELRPLVDKLNISPEEKFDTYLLLIRSTDDRALVAPAHEAAKQITDEARRAQALLDIIKEIDFLSGGSQQLPQ